MRSSDGGEGLIDKPRRPHTIHRLNLSTVEKVIQLGQQHGWFGEAISAHLRQEGVEVSNGSIYRILHNHALTVQGICAQKKENLHTLPTYASRQPLADRYQILRQRNRWILRQRSLHE